jgi:hypothetical protein
MEVTPTVIWESIMDWLSHEEIISISITCKEFLDFYHTNEYIWNNTKVVDLHNISLIQMEKWIQHAKPRSIKCNDIDILFYLKYTNTLLTYLDLSGATNLNYVSLTHLPIFRNLHCVNLNNYLTSKQDIYDLVIIAPSLKYLTLNSKYLILDCFNDIRCNMNLKVLNLNKEDKNNIPFIRDILGPEIIVTEF